MSSPQPRRSQERLALGTYVKLMRAANSARNFATRSLCEAGVTLTQFAVLEALYHLGPMSLSDIAQKVLTTGGNLTMVVRNLEKQGLARRQECPEDRRISIVVLTAKGKSLIRAMFPRHAAAIVEFLSVLSPEQQAHLGELCRKLGRQEAGRRLLDFESSFNVKASYVVDSRGSDDHHQAVRRTRPRQPRLARHVLHFLIFQLLRSEAHGLPRPACHQRRPGQRRQGIRNASPPGYGDTYLHHRRRVEPSRQHGTRRHYQAERCAADVGRHRRDAQ